MKPGGLRLETPKKHDHREKENDERGADDNG